MVTIVFVIGALNFALGFALAVLLERPWGIPVPAISKRLRWQSSGKSKKKAKPASAKPGTEVPPQVKPQAPAPAAAAADSLPADWQAVLTTLPVAARSFSEAAVWVAEARFNELGERIRQRDQHAQFAPDFPFAATKTLADECLALVQAMQHAIQVRAQQSADSAGPPRNALDTLAQEGLEQAAGRFQQLANYCLEAEQDTEKAADHPAARQELLDTYALVRGLADQCRSGLARYLEAEQRIAELTDGLIIDAPSTALTRFGMELTVQQWLEKDPDRVRMASAILLDLDECGALNRREGIARASKALAKNLGLVVEVIRKDRGFDRVIQLTNQSIVVFLGDTAMRNAVMTAERVRQHLQVTSFTTKEGNITLSTSCSVGEWNPSETFEELLGRLRAGMREAKAAGRNCTVSCGPDEVRVIQSSRLQLQPREISLD